MRGQFNFNLSMIVALALSANGSAQTKVFQVSKRFDSVDAPAAYAFPGLAGGFRQQILISSSRLSGLQGKTLRGLWVRRDLHDRDALTGGSVDFEIRISTARTTPEKASPVFASNAGLAPMLAFRGRVPIPNSPKLSTNVLPWSAPNSIKINFSTPFVYAGGDLCIDVVGRPVSSGQPDFWFIDYEDGNYSGGSKSIGKSCSRFATVSGETLFANDFLLQIGSSLSLTALGAPGSTPLMLLGVRSIPAGVDLTMMGATGCRKYVDYLLVLRLAYSNPKNAKDPASLRFQAQIPSDTNLLGASVFTQIADDEGALPITQRTNPAGLTTSNGLELKISSLGPDLGMAIVTSRKLKASVPPPTRGSVDVSIGPVLRLTY